MNNVVAAYLATWNSSDTATRTDLLTKHWAETATYVDPGIEVTGRDAIDATIAAAQAQFPGLAFNVLGVPDSHHRQVRFQWGLGPEGSEPLVVGFDVIVVDADGRIQTVLGFLDKVPE